MTIFRSGLIIGCALTSLGLSAPATATVFIEGRADGAPFTLLDSGPVAANYFGVIGAFTITATGAVSLPAGTLAKLGSTLLAARSDLAAHTLDVEASVTDVTAADFKVLSAFTQNASPGWSVTEETWLDPTNTPFGLDTLVDSKSYTVLGADASTSGPMSLSSVFSLTHVYHLSVGASAVGSSLSTISESLQTSAVPEPDSWALMMAGFGATGFIMRRRYTGQKLRNVRIENR